MNKWRRRRELDSRRRWTDQLVFRSLTRTEHCRLQKEKRKMQKRLENVGARTFSTYNSYCSEIDDMEQCLTHLRVVSYNCIALSRISEHKLTFVPFEQVPAIKIRTINRTPDPARNKSPLTSSKARRHTHVKAVCDHSRQNEEEIARTNRDEQTKRKCAFNAEIIRPCFHCLFLFSADTCVACLYWGETEIRFLLPNCNVFFRVTELLLIITRNRSDPNGFDITSPEITAKILLFSIKRTKTHCGSEL